VSRETQGGGSLEKKRNGKSHPSYEIQKLTALLMEKKKQEEKRGGGKRDGLGMGTEKNLLGPPRFGERHRHCSDRKR